MLSPIRTTRKLYFPMEYHFFHSIQSIEWSDYLAGSSASRLENTYAHSTGIPSLYFLLNDTSLYLTLDTPMDRMDQMVPIITERLPPKKFYIT